MSYYFVYRLCKHYQSTGTLEAKKVGGYTQPKVDKVGEEQIKAWLAESPDLTLNQLCEKYQHQFQITLGKSSMDRALKRADIRVKKKAHTIRKNIKQHTKNAEKPTFSN